MKTTWSQAIALVLCTGTIAQAVFAAEAEIPTRGPIAFSTYDLDGNGIISNPEFTTVQEQRQQQRAMERIPKSNAPPPPSFSDYDRNGDNGISEDELLAGQKAQMLKRADMMDTGKPPGIGVGHIPLFSEFDQNNDGVIMEHEYDEAQKARADERARQGYMMRGLGNGKVFADYDLNADGEVIPQEFSAAQSQHSAQQPD